MKFQQLLLHLYNLEVLLLFFLPIYLTFYPLHHIINPFFLFILKELIILF